MFQRAGISSGSGEEKYYHTSTTYGTKTFNCGFRPKVILVIRNDSASNRNYGCVYAEHTPDGDNKQHQISGGGWQAVGSGTAYNVIGAISNTGFTMSTTYTVACDVYAWG